ncbi:hypothetical protein CXG81DRAFT_21193 [Caulochytrium protostelioides]|uniref:Copper transport protein n=1 Tax=Caulochytrium protostelioides TaxID=1555241 RepID=A0A4P9WYQ8_9FUNG|nr:hypothetical protein CXG81DRAFT_21193 [Caulochytrium protostelioides]|eukprot:RKO98604.1 hypothetical protein CXG81DRAFT_21193 [Caulochytrium protostelioides]
MSGMDHSMPGMDHSMPGMKMLWNWDTSTVLIFDWWRTDGPVTLLLSCMAVFAMAYGSEWFQSYRAQRDRVLLQRAAAVGGPAVAVDHEATDLLADQDADLHAAGGRNVAGSRLHVARVDTSHGRYYQALRAVLRAVESFIGLFIMLLFMSFNGYIIFSVVAGTAAGFFVHQRGQAGKSSLACH